VSVESFTQPYRLEPYNEEEAKKKAALKPSVYHVFEGYVKQLTQLGIPVTMEMQDYQLTNFMNSIDRDMPIDRKITTMVRQKDVDWLGDKKRKEFLIWYETWTGYRNDGKLPSGGDRISEFKIADYPRGLDKRTNVRAQEYNAKGDPLPAKPGVIRWICTEIFSAEKVDKIMEDTVDTGPDTVQWIVTGNGSWGGFTMEEFQKLSFEELEERGKKGTAGSPVTKKKPLRGVRKDLDRGKEQENRD
jgi:hypothetical protein